MLSTLILAIIAMFFPTQPKWDELKAFEVYSVIEIRKFHQLNDADIEKMSFKTADLDEAKKILSSSKQIIEPIMWKGMARLAVAKFKDGSSRKILINTYGSTFRDVTGKADYTLEDNADAWHKFISQNKPLESDKQ